MNTITPRYFAAYRDQSGWHDISWNVRASANQTGHGYPTEANAEKLRKSLNNSFQPSGVNGHVSRAVGYVIHVSAIRVYRNIPSQPVVAESKAPMFEVV